MSDTIAAVSTGMQVSAIGIVRLSGDDAINIVDKLFIPQSGKKMSGCADRQLVFGRLMDVQGETLDICLCTVSRAPHSYTGENTAELQCHGSPAVLRAALDAVFALGARQALPGEFTKRAFLNGRMDLTSAEAVADIIDAETAEAAKNAAGQLGGAISRRIDRIYGFLTDLSSHYHAVLDYPDEDIEDFRLESYKSQLCDAIVQLKRLGDSYSGGKLLRDGIPAAIIGRPNAGKSSLLNAVLGYDRAIVTNIPGTTRDTIEEKLRLGGVLLRLTDTAGLRDTDDEIERLGVMRSHEAMENAELVIAVIDGSDELSPEDAEIIRYAENAPLAVIAVSKSDLGKAAVLPETTLPVVELSSVTGEGLDKLAETVKSIFPMPDSPAGEILTNARQAEAVNRALVSLRAAYDALLSGCTPDIVLTEAEGAMSALGELSGRTVREDVTNRIFERFCVGK
ncbi:MAG: tRNA uridine-5-carboxymethylaminomethyl(34) synthesis GTPase MnmE [Oscillospiraceae bacterium]|nr:tRNA uridine-5-carboxymethylaminomethyl(34) synthesis GTPase MnmE [Oscillospiraceae bacterium]